MMPTPVNTKTSDNVGAIRADGTAFPADVGASKGVTLGVNTYYFPIGSSDAPLSAGTSLTHVHLKWAAAVAGTITIETCSFARYAGGFGSSIDDVTDNDGTVGNWIPENPAGASVAVVGAGNSAAGLVVTAGGANAGGCSIHLGNLGSRRARVKIVTTVGGLVRCGVNGKIG